MKISKKKKKISALSVMLESLPHVTCFTINPHLTHHISLCSVFVLFSNRYLCGDFLFACFFSSFQLNLNSVHSSSLYFMGKPLLSSANMFLKTCLYH